MKGCDSGKMKAMVELQDISKSFGESVIIPDLNLSINDGEFLTLLGPSGCGKTTLLRMIAGLETPTRGKVILDGEDVTHLPPYKRNVNMVFQNYALFPHMTVEENIQFGLKMKRVPTEEAQDRIKQVLYLTQLEELRTRYPQQMSGGQQQRVAIARALMQNPAIVLADEPVASLDPATADSIMQYLAEINSEGISVLCSLHFLSLARRYGNRVVALKDGLKVYEGLPVEIDNARFKQIYGQDAEEV